MPKYEPKIVNTAYLVAKAAMLKLESSENQNVDAQDKIASVIENLESSNPDLKN